jgi:site-specific recombinase XerD
MIDPCWARVEGPLAPYVAGFRGELERLGYTPLTSAGHVRLMAHLSRWMIAEGVPAAGLTPARVDAYFARRRAAGYVNSVTGRSLRPLLEHLRRLGVAPPCTPMQAVTPVEVLLGRYRDYLERERGLAFTTVELNVRLVRPFLTERALAHGEGGLDLEHLSAGEVTAFVVAESRARPRSVKRMVTALRSLLVFLHVDGVIAGPLATAIPMVAARRPSGLPTGLGADQVTAMVASCDRGSGTGRRDFAILTLLVRLGLRAGEVAGLGLDDIDWRRGEITVRGKGNRQDTLPLPTDVGTAIVDYLQHARPQTAQGRTVFVRAQAPYEGLTYHGVTTVVAAAGRRAGVGLVHAHRLRHSAATAMLAGGGSLQEIGQVLRHRRPLTTAVYAKVDTQVLAPLARPWPGEPA